MRDYKIIPVEMWTHAEAEEFEKHWQENEKAGHLQVLSGELMTEILSCINNNPGVLRDPIAHRDSSKILRCIKEEAVKAWRKKHQAHFKPAFLKTIDVSFEFDHEEGILKVSPEGGLKLLMTGNSKDIHFMDGSSPMFRFATKPKSAKTQKSKGMQDGSQTY